jgi:hypothetical protein
LPILSDTLNSLFVIQLAGDYYKRNGQTGKAAQTYVFAANLCAPVDSAAATDFFVVACEAWEADEEKALQANDTFKQTVSHLVQIEEYELCTVARFSVRGVVFRHTQTLALHHVISPLVRIRSFAGYAMP